MEQLFPRLHAATTLGEDREQLELRGGQVELPPAEGGPERRAVDDDVPRGQHVAVRHRDLLEPHELADAVVHVDDEVAYLEVAEVGEEGGGQRALFAGGSAALA